MTSLSGGISGGGGGPANTDALAEGVSNLYFTETRVVDTFQDSPTNDIELFSGLLPTNHYSFNEGSGLILGDAFNLSNGTISGSSLWGSGYLEQDNTTGSDKWETGSGFGSISDFSVAYWVTPDILPFPSHLLQLGNRSTGVTNQSFTIETDGINLYFALFTTSGSNYLNASHVPVVGNKYLIVVTYRRNGGIADNEMHIRYTKDGITWYDAFYGAAGLMYLDNSFTFSQSATGLGGSNKAHALSVYSQVLDNTQIQQIWDAGSEAYNGPAKHLINVIDNSSFQKHSFIATSQLTPAQHQPLLISVWLFGDGAVSSGGIAIGQNAVADAGFAFGESYSNGGIAMNIGNNTNAFGAIGSNTIALGPQNIASGSNSVTIGADNQAIAQESVAIGRSNISNGIGATALGYFTKTDSSYSTAIGFESVARLEGTVAQGSGKFVTAGDVQKISAFLKQETTNGVQNQLYLLNNSGELILQDNSTWGFKGLLTGRDSSGNTSIWEISGAVKRGSGIATVSLVGTPAVTLLAQDAGASGWGGPAINVDTATFGSLVVNVTGQTGVNIRWSCDLSISEILF